MELAKDLETDIITTHIGVIPNDKNHERYKIMQEACYTLSRFADSLDAHFAIETGPEKAKTLCSFIKDVNSKGIGVNLDPANLVMVAGDDPVEAVYTLKDFIVHTHAKDGIMKNQTDPKIIYNFFAEGGIEDLRMSDYFLELPLGEGSVPFDKYLKALEEIGFKGFLTIERECGENPYADIKKAADFLNSKI
jgi:sugar phosphate isomerase/epimerase